MLSLEQCKKILGERARNYTDGQLEGIRDELYILAGLAFEHWKHCSSTKAEEKSSAFVGEQAPSTPLPTGELADAK
jgi:hypothetical protein